MKKDAQINPFLPNPNAILELINAQANSYSHPNETAKESVLVKKREDRKYAFSGRVKGAKRND